jgi:hypothetical protein
MSRSLPLGTPLSDAESVGGIVEVYDPAMCCASGVCGPGVDPALLQIARDLRWLKTRGATVTRHGLSQEPDAFVSNARVVGMMATLGDAALPVTFVNGHVLASGRYPTRDELARALGPSAPAVTSDASAACCAPGSGRCEP